MEIGGVIFKNQQLCVPYFSVPNSKTIGHFFSKISMCLWKK